MTYEAAIDWFDHHNACSSWSYSLKDDPALAARVEALRAKIAEHTKWTHGYMTVGIPLSDEERDLLQRARAHCGW